LLKVQLTFSLFSCVRDRPILMSARAGYKINVISREFTVCIATPQIV